MEGRKGTVRGAEAWNLFLVIEFGWWLDVPAAAAPAAAAGVVIVIEEGSTTDRMG